MHASARTRVVCGGGGETKELGGSVLGVRVVNSEKDVCVDAFWGGV